MCSQRKKKPVTQKEARWPKNGPQKGTLGLFHWQVTGRDRVKGGQGCPRVNNFGDKITRRCAQVKAFGYEGEEYLWDDRPVVEHFASRRCAQVVVVCVAQFTVAQLRMFCIAHGLKPEYFQ